MANANVHISQLENIVWLNSALCDLNVDKTNHIWRVNIDSQVAYIVQFLALLSADEHQRANRYHHQKDQHQFTVARGALRILLGKYLDTEPTQIVFESGINNKPYFKNNKGLHFNVSHSGNYALIAFSSLDIGVDVELIDTNFDYKQVMSVYNNAEAHYVDTSPNPIHTFYTLWIRKEAQLKASAKGIDDDLKLVPAINGLYNIAGIESDLFVKNFDVDDFYLGCVASDYAESLFLDFNSQVVI